MRYSKIFGKTNKTSKEYDSVNATLLIKAGFIDQTMAGVYTFLPLGLRVLTKIETIIREEMDKIGSEMLMSALVPNELWETTGRYEGVDVLFKAEGANKLSQTKNDASYVLSPTHEEAVTPIAKSFNVSYKDLPFAVYQIQTKFRNESRPKSGLMRGREFRMKDLYSFHKSEAELKEYYKVAKEAYFNVFNRVGLGAETYYVAASGGDFTEDFSHEFQTRCDTGEDIIFYSPEDKAAYNREVAPCMAVEPKNQEKEMGKYDEVFGENIIGVKELCEFLHTTPEHTTKTLFYDTDKGPIIAAVRGDYEVNEWKLQKAAQVKWVKLCEPETITKLTGAQVGYAGIVNTPKGIPVYIDEAVKYLTNFETGCNKTNYHAVNVNWGRDVQMPEVMYDIKLAKEGDLYTETGKPYEVFRASEVGNIFPLNTKFSKAFNYYFTDENGKQQIVYMGSYGIGSSRVMGVIVEKFHDNKGIIWPKQIAPFQVHLVGLNLDDEAIRKQAEELYERLKENNFEVLFDDRNDVSAGAKFADADLIGIPVRVVISKKTNGKVEVKGRTEEKAQMLEENDLVQYLYQQFSA